MFIKKHNNIIYINGRFLTQEITGVQRYALELVKALDDLIDKGEIEINNFIFCLLSPKNVKYDLTLKRIVHKKVGHLKGHLWEQLELPFHAGRGLLINMCNTAPLVKKNQIVTIHDASVFGFPTAYSFLFRTWYKFLMTSHGKRVSRIVTDSFFSKGELVRYCGILEDKLRVVYLGKEHILNVTSDETLLAKHSLIDRPFVLAVSSMNPNKNFQAIAQAIELLGDVEFDLVIAGGTHPIAFSSATIKLSPWVKHLGYVEDGALRALYEHAACFVYPSFYEGFGLPPLEAMACGCPVIISKAASLPEVCGDAALYCDPCNPEDIAEKIQILISDAMLRDALRRKGLERAGLFTWECCARQTFQVIQEVLS